MKRNKQLNRAVRKTRTASGCSRYEDKRRQGNQMYGPECCAHTVTSSQIQAARSRAQKSASSISSIYRYTQQDWGTDWVQP